MGWIILDGTLLGAMGFALMSAVSLIRKKHCRGMLFGISSTASYMLFAWLWYSSFEHKHPGVTWVELAFHPVFKDSKQNTVFLVCGLALALANVLGIVIQKNSTALHPSSQIEKFDAKKHLETGAFLLFLFVSLNTISIQKIL